MNLFLQKLFEDALIDATQTHRVAGAEKNTADSGVKYELKQIPTKSEIEDNIRSVVNMESLTRLNGTEFSKGEIDLVTQVTSYFESIGGFVETPYGKVELTRNGVKSSIAHGIGRNKAIAFSAVPDVLVRGKIIDYQNNRKQRGYDTIAVAAPIDIGEKGYYLAAIVKVENERNGYYLHEVALQEKEDTSAFKTVTAKSGTPSAEISSIYTLLNKLQDVKEKQLKVSEDAPKTQNGLPEGVIKYQLKNTDNLSDTELLAQYLERNGQVAESVLRKVSDIELSDTKAKRLVTSKLKEYGIESSVARESADYINTTLELESSLCFMLSARWFRFEAIVL